MAHVPIRQVITVRLVEVVVTTAFHAEHVQAVALLALSQKEMDSSLSMLIHASLVEHVHLTAQLELSKRHNCF